MSGEINQIRVTIGADKMTASVVLSPGLDALMRSAVAVHAALDERGVASSPQRSRAVDDLVSRYSPESGCEGVVARGVPPVQGTHGRVEVLPKFLSVSPPPDTNDYHARTTCVAVAAGEVVALIHPSVPGTDGVDVMGRQLLCKSALDATITIDHTLERRPSGELVALVAGLLIFSGSLIRVSDTLSIESDVDFSTGNLNFPGNIEIARGVRDCFQVRCTGALRIAGLVEAAALDAGLDAVLDTGMAGRESGTLRVGRDLTAKYLEGVHAVVGRDAVVTSVLTNSCIRVGRSLVAPQATIIGGSTDVRGAAQVGQLGSEAKVPTEIIVGHDSSLEQGLVKGLSLCSALNERILGLRGRIDALRNASGRKNAPAAEEVTSLELDLDVTSTKRDSLRAALDRTLNALDSYVDGKLVVLSCIYPGVKIWLGCQLIEPRERVAGSLTFVVDSNGKLQISRDAQDASMYFKVCSGSRFPDRAAIRRDLAA